MESIYSIEVPRVLFDIFGNVDYAIKGLRFPTEAQPPGGWGGREGGLPCPFLKVERLSQKKTPKPFLARSVFYVLQMKCLSKYPYLGNLPRSENFLVVLLPFLCRD